METYWLFQWRQPKSHAMRTKLDIYIKIAITGSVPLMVNY